MTQLTLFLVTLASLSGAALPAHDIWGSWQGNRRTVAATRITGDQLEQMLGALRGKPDGKVAEQLSMLELTERLSAARLERCMADLSGPQARQAFTVLVDESAFLDPSAGDIPSIEKPDMEVQRQMTSLMIDYVKETIRQLPNLFATRTTLSFEEDLSTDRPLHPMGKFSVIVLYRDGEEELHSSLAQSGKEKQHPNLFSSQVPGLTTSGEFGPILVTAIVDAAHGDMVWNRWEQGATGPEAVFRYAVTAENSHYKVDEKYTGYRGEIAMNPRTGTILRLVLRSDPQPGDPLLRADIVVEYGPVELGGKTYICPVRSAALSVAGLTSESINDVVFDQYHLYQASSRILPGFSAIP